MSAKKCEEKNMFNAILTQTNTKYKQTDTFFLELIFIKKTLEYEYDSVKKHILHSFRHSIVWDFNERTQFYFDVSEDYEIASLVFNASVFIKKKIEGRSRAFTHTNRYTFVCLLVCLFFVILLPVVFVYRSIRVSYPFYSTFSA